MKRLGLVASPVLAVVLIACGSAEPSPTGPGQQSAGEWEAMASAPLSPRQSAHAFAVGGKLLIMGGTEADPCPPTADCVEPSEPPRRDSAMYDPGTDEWSSIADAPVPLGYGSGAVVDGRVYLLLSPYGSSHPSLRQAFVSYDPAQDRWRELPLPSKDTSIVLTAGRSEVIAYQSSQENGVEGDFVFDPNSERWQELPADPLRPSYDRTMVWTDAGLVLVGLEVVPNPGAEKPSLYRAAVLERGRWTRLPDSEIVGANPLWSWSAGRVVNSSIDRFDGGETNNWGRFYPAGGMLDPAAQEWSELPETPDEPGQFTGIHALGDRGVVMGNGWIFAARAGRWHHLERPDNAPETGAATAWVGDELFVWGGARYEESEGVLSNKGWSLQPDW